MTALLFLIPLGDNNKIIYIALSKELNTNYFIYWKVIYFI